MGKGAKIKLEDKDTDALFRECPIETYPGLAIQSVTDSSRCTSGNFGSNESHDCSQIFCHQNY